MVIMRENYMEIAECLMEVHIHPTRRMKHWRDRSAIGKIAALNEWENPSQWDIIHEYERLARNG